MLFKADDIRHTTKKKTEMFDAFSVFDQITNTILIKNRDHLSSVIPVIEQNRNYEFVNAGRWSAHDLLFYLLSLTEPAKVTISTWAISQAAIELLFQGVKSGLISELHGIFDRRLPIRKGKAAQFIQSICTRFVLVDCHSKNFLIENNEWKISSSMTCNYSNNRRIETGKFSTYPEIFSFHNFWMDAVLNGEDLFKWKN